MSESPRVGMFSTEVPIERGMEPLHPVDEALTSADQGHELVVVIPTLEVERSVPVAAQEMDIRRLGEASVDLLVCETQLAPSFNDDVERPVPVRKLCRRPKADVESALLVGFGSEARREIEEPTAVQVSPDEVAVQAQHLLGARRCRLV